MAWFDDYERCADAGAVMSMSGPSARCDCYYCTTERDDRVRRTLAAVGVDAGAGEG